MFYVANNWVLHTPLDALMAEDQQMRGNFIFLTDFFIVSTPLVFSVTNKCMLEEGLVSSVVVT